MAPKEKLAVVTGTTSGIGAAVADGLLRDGWNVIGLGRRAADIDHRRYRHLRADLSDLPALQALAEGELAPAARDPRWTRVGLVNNAGVIGDGRPLEKSDAADLGRVFAVNAAAPVFLMGFLVRAAPPGTPIRIVNVSTGAAQKALPGSGVYGASKAALRLAGMNLAEELGSPDRPGGTRPGVAILSYEPGVVDTAMQEEARSADRPWNRVFRGFREQGRLLPPEAPAAEIVAFLEGDGAETFTERRIGED